MMTTVTFIAAHIWMTDSHSAFCQHLKTCVYCSWLI